MTSLSFIDAGNMAEAMIRGLLRGNVFAPGDPCPCGSGKNYKKCQRTAA
ncbi:MAG TPA: SEC-C metal-binding domain-containing protein [Thermoanaerobaculia bacterium]|jgi:uncharacterized protein YecA (UPF0149 family)